ncbi:peptidoglycan editing factor PgeF [Alteraurantiacibacter aquimixticola]|uniref:Purine nucleoside phosphorylase n=1 Tax=Alteraurantiacibacter aquimixticola TaxID=2489173 RepID=A0A4T3EXA3_9SPHN|nr:peptidoglycan editing factor PgeF [Alteraurantiacibacter aquimixticola]TIX49225.1 peptidoglycan editing factor PgeF [Alteraurantiacibacter aquimixticola]
MADLVANPVEVIRASALDFVPHGFLGCRGGVSTGFAAGLQVGLNAGDDDDAVAENRRRALAAVVPGAQLVTVKQVHSPVAIIADAPWPEDARPEADAIVTATPGLALAIVTADCAPVLFADREAGVVGAAHAGWRGAHGGVLEQTVARMVELGADPTHIVAAIGPCIAQDSYEVGEDLRAQFTEADARFFADGAPGKWQFDLEAYVASRLKALGLAAVEPLGLDTYADPSRFYSHRRSVHRGEPTYGREFSLIAL